VLVDEFNCPFNDDGVMLNAYKREIHAHVENGLGSNLKSRLSAALALNVDSAQREMTGKSLRLALLLRK
jgi:mitofusin